MKNLFLCAVFTFVMAFASAVIFAGCQNEIISDSENVDFILTQWNCFTDGAEYPELSRWKIRAGSADFYIEAYESANAHKITFEVNKNEPFYVLAYPVTKLCDGSEIQFFKPAGAIYPYAAQGDFYSNGSRAEVALTWEDGFSASIMDKIVQSKKRDGISSSELKTFLMQFNWAKMQEKIKKNLSDNLSAFGEPDQSRSVKFYNPWHINQQKLLENLCAQDFDSNLLKSTSIFTVSLDGSSLCGFKNVLSSFVLENQIVQNYKLLTVKKHQLQIFMLDNSVGALLDATSAKNISVELGNMPILIEDYENSK